MGQAKRKHSIRSRILLSVALGNLLIMLFYEVPSFLLTVEKMRMNFISRSSQVINRLQETLSLPLWNLDSEAIRQVVNVEMQNSDLAYIYIYKPRLAIILDDLVFENPAEYPDAKNPLYSFMNIQAVDTKFFPVRYRNEHVADIKLALLFPDLVSEWNSLLLRILVELFMFIILISVVLTLILERIIHEPLGRVLKKVGKLTKGEFGYPLNLRRNDEFGSLAEGINTMEEELSGLYQRLREQNSELAHTVQERTDSLIESEKRASVSRLVAGIAHELNTPIGLTLTMATHGLDLLQDLEMSYKNGSLTKSAMERFLETSRESYNLTVQTITHASELIQSFKRVSVDHFSEELTRFGLIPHIERIIPSVSKLLHTNRIHIEVAGDEKLELFSYPNFLTQIILNLIMNTIMHAYDADDQCKRRILIEVYQSTNDDTVHIRFSNNGKPIPLEHQKHMWEAFYTTNRGAGGTGLGLFIIRSIIEQQLKGTIRLLPKSVFEEEKFWQNYSGVSFDITLQNLSAQI